MRPRLLPTNREVQDQLEALIASGSGDDPELAMTITESDLDRFHYFEILLRPLEEVRQNPEVHPEGDALYHSLQVFQLARQELPYDEEFLLAALLHDVGKAIDRRDPVAATLESLEGFISPRTAWLIEYHAQAQELRRGQIGHRSRRRLEADENFEELVLLADCDRAGRVSGVQAGEIEDAIDYLRELADECEE